jgi:hypothetical protein
MRNRYSSLSYLERLNDKIQEENAKRARFLVDVDKKIAILCGVALFVNAVSMFVR